VTCLLRANSGPARVFHLQTAVFGLRGYTSIEGRVDLPTIAASALAMVAGFVVADVVPSTLPLAFRTLLELGISSAVFYVVRRKLVRLRDGTD